MLESLIDGITWQIYLFIYLAAGGEERPTREVASHAGHDVRDAGETRAGRHHGRETEKVGRNSKLLFHKQSTYEYYYYYYYHIIIIIRLTVQPTLPYLGYRGWLSLPSPLALLCCFSCHFEYCCWPGVSVIAVSLCCHSNEPPLSLLVWYTFSYMRRH